MCSIDVAFNLSDSKVERRCDFTLLNAENDRSSVKFVANVHKYIPPPTHISSYYYPPTHRDNNIITDSHMSRGGRFVFFKTENKSQRRTKSANSNGTKKIQ